VAKSTYQAPRRAADVVPIDDLDEPIAKPPTQRSTAKTVKPVKAKKIFSYKMETEIGERLWEYWRAQTRGRTIGEIVQEAMLEYLERHNGY